MLTETWLGSIIGKCILSEPLPDGYTIQNAPRCVQRGGGVAIIHKLDIPVKRVPTKKSPSHLELLQCNISSSRKNVRLFVIYRQPPSRANKFKTSSFFEESLDFIDYTMRISDDIILTGDLNFTLDDKFDSDARKFTETLSDRGLVQHVVGATHCPWTHA